MGGKLGGAQAQPVEVAQDAEVAVQVEAALQVEHRGDLALLVDALDVARVQRQFDLVAVLLQLREGQVHQPQHLPGFEALGVVVLGHEDGEEHGVHAAFFGAGQVELPVGHAFADIAAVIKLAVDDVHVAVEDEGIFVEFARAVGNLGRQRRQYGE